MIASQTKGNLLNARLLEKSTEAALQSQSDPLALDGMGNMTFLLRAIDQLLHRVLLATVGDDGGLVKAGGGITGRRDGSATASGSSQCVVGQHPVVQCVSNVELSSRIDARSSSALKASR